MSSFPDFDFKLDCGDDPRVRQWLHDNGCRLSFGIDADDLKGHRELSCRSLIIYRIVKSLGDVSLPLINPYDYIQTEPTAADRMAEIKKRFWDQYDFLMKQAQDRATIKPDLTVAPGRNDEMVERDERESTLKEKYVMWQSDQAEIKPITRQLTIPAICLRDQAMPMMLGGDFGGRYGHR